MSNPELMLVVFACVVIWRRLSISDALALAAIFAFVWAVSL